MFHIKDFKSDQVKFCYVCRDHLKKRQPKVNLPCGHNRIHPSCLFQWLFEKDECPLCRKFVLRNITDEMRAEAEKKRHDKNTRRNAARSKPKPPSSDDQQPSTSSN